MFAAVLHCHEALTRQCSRNINISQLSAKRWSWLLQHFTLRCMRQTQRCMGFSSGRQPGALQPAVHSRAALHNADPPTPAEADPNAPSSYTKPSPVQFASIAIYNSVTAA